MPAAIVGYLASAGAVSAGIVAAGSIGATLIGVGASLVISQAQGKRAQRKAADAANRAYEASLQDRTTVIRSPIVPRNIVLGRTRTSGPLACWFTYGDKQQYHAFAVVLAGHECDAIEQYYFNEEPVTIDGNGWVTDAKWCKKEVVAHSEVLTFDGSGNATATYTPVGTQAVSAKVRTVNPDGFEDWLGLTWSGTTLNSTTVASTSAQVQYSHEVVTPLFRVRGYLGASGQTAAQELIDAATAAGNGSAWGPTRKGTQVCYCTVVMEADYDVLGQIGVPNISAVVRGVKARPLVGAAAWTQNPALLARWFLVDSIYSPTTLEAEVGADELAASVGVCNESLAFSATRTEARYICNGQLSSDTIPRDNLTEILKCMAGSAVWVSGAWQIVAGYHKPVSLALTESDLSGADITVAPYAPKDKLFNLVTGTYVDPSMGYTRTSFPAVTVSAYVAEDNGEVLPLSVDYGLVDDSVRCQYLSWLTLTIARQQLTATLGTNLRGYDTWPTENITVRLLDIFGATPKELNVLRREFDGSTCNYVLQETAEEVWDWDYADANQPVDIPNTSLPDPFTLPAPVITAAESGDAQLLIGDDGSITSRVKISLAGTNNTYIVNGGGVETRYAPSGTEEWQAGPAPRGNALEYWVSPVQDGVSYMHQARYINASGRLSPWSPVWIDTVVGKLEPPPNVQNMTIAGDALSWQPVVANDLAGYVFRFHYGQNTDWGSAAPLHTGFITESPYALTSRPGGPVTIMVKAVDTTGNLSVLSANVFTDLGDAPIANVVEVIDFQALSWPIDPDAGLLAPGNYPQYIEASLESVERASVATYVDSAGVMQTAAVDEPRFTYNPTTLEPEGLLVEGEATNQLIRSQEFDNASWGKTRCSVTANATTAPDGTLTADKLVEDTTATSTHTMSMNGATIGAPVGQYCASIFLKSDGSGRHVRLRMGDTQFLDDVVFDPATGTFSNTAAEGYGVTQYPDGWFRVHLVETTDENNALTFQVGLANPAVLPADATIYSGDGASGVYLWGAQLEEGTEPTSYIPTVSSTVTRAADIIYASTGQSGYEETGGELQALALDSFYGTDNQSFYGADTAPFYESSAFGQLIYTTDEVVISSALNGSILTLEIDYDGADLTIEYRLAGPGTFYGADADSFYGPDAEPFYGDGPSDWFPWPGQLTAQNSVYQFRVTIGAGPEQGVIREMTLTIDAPDIEEDIQDVPIDIGGTAIPYIKNFTVIKTIVPGLQAALSGAIGIDLDKTTNLAPIAFAVDGSGTPVAGATSDFRLKGY